MKAKTLSLMATAGFGGALLLTQSAPAAFVGLEVEAKANDFGLFVCNVYAVFDNPNDVMVAVAGTPLAALDVSVIGGTFYQHPFGGDTAPSLALIGLFPSLAYDTFVTIGKKTDADDQTSLTPGWPGFGASQLPTDPVDAANIGWFITPDQQQGVPDIDGRVLIGQFSSADVDLAVEGNGIAGSFLVQAVSDGDQGFQATASFFHGTPVPGPGALALLGLAGVVGRRRRR